MTGACRWGSLGRRSKVGPNEPVFEWKHGSKRRRILRPSIGCACCKCAQGTVQSTVPSRLLQGFNRPLPATLDGMSYYGSVELGPTFHLLLDFLVDIGRSLTTELTTCRQLFLVAPLPSLVSSLPGLFHLASSLDVHLALAHWRIEARP